VCASPGIKPGYIVGRTAIVWKIEEKKFLAVRWVVMTHRERRVDRPFPVT
jgi:hypothetical protein